MDIPFFRTKHHSPHRIAILAAIFFVSLLSGYAGGLLSTGQQISEPELRPPVLIEDRSQPVQKPSSAADSIYSDVRPSIVTLYRLNGRSDVKPLAALSLTKEQFLGYALVVTSDGWLATTVPLAKNDLSSILVVDREQVLYRPQTVIGDTATPARFLKIAASSLKPAQLSSENAPIVQDGYLVRDMTAESLSVSLPFYPLPSDPSDAILSSELLQKRFNLDTVFVESGLPLVNLQKVVIGLTDARGAVPMPYIHRGLRSILKTGALQRPKAGLSYHDYGLRREAAGAAIVPKKGMSQTVPTPTGTERFFSGDLVTGVNVDAVSAQRSLSELLNEYQPGDPVQLHIKRGSQTVTITLTLQ